MSRGLGDVYKRQVIGLFILSQPLVSTEIYHKDIKMLTEKELSVSSIRALY